MIFKKIQASYADSKPYWVLYIDNDHDLKKYLSWDKELYIRTLLGMRKEDNTIRIDHLSGAREKILAVTVECDTVMRVKKSPPDLVNGIMIEKAGTMFDVMNEDGAIQINHFGGYSPSNHFMKLHDVSVLETLEKDDVVFPADDEPIKAHVLILENDVKCSENFYWEIQRLTATVVLDIHVITNLKDTDINWVHKCIMLSENIAFETQAVNEYQIKQFMKIFAAIPQCKNVYIKTNNPTDITNHELFETNNKLHNIKFI